MHSDSPLHKLGALAAISSLLLACTAGSTPAPTMMTAPSVGGLSPSITAPSSTPTPTAPTGALPPPETREIRLGVITTEITSFAAVQASVEQIFDRYGLASTVTLYEGPTAALEALQSGELDMVTIEHGSALSTQDSSAPLVVVGLPVGILGDNLVCKSGIGSADDVKGKKIGTSTFGGRDHAAALLALKQLGLQPSDATITEVGGTNARLGAIGTGAIDCAVVSKDRRPDVGTQDLSGVTSLWRNPVQPYARAELVVPKSLLASSPNTVLVALAAVLEGQNMIWTDPGKSAENYAKWAQVDETEARALVDDFATIGNRSLMWTDAAFENSRDVLATVNPAIGDVSIPDAVDPSLLDKLVDIGFYAKIGNPDSTP